MTDRYYMCLNYCGHFSKLEIFMCPKCGYDHGIVQPEKIKPSTINSSLTCQHLWGMADEEHSEHNHTVLLKLTCSHCEAIIYPNHLPRDMQEDELPW